MEEIEWIWFHKMEKYFVWSWIGGNLARCASRWRRDRAALGRYGRLILLMLSLNAGKFFPIAINLWEGDGTLSWKL